MNGDCGDCESCGSLSPWRCCCAECEYCGDDYTPARSTADGHLRFCSKKCEDRNQKEFGDSYE